MTGTEEFETTAKWLEVRKRIAKKLVNDMESVVDQIDEGKGFDMYTLQFVMSVCDYCDKILLGSKEKN